MKYFKYFTIPELVSSCTDYEILECIKRNNFDNILTLATILDELRDFLESPIVVTSSFRSYVHNKNVGGSPTSQHLYGAAIDFKVPSIPYSSLVVRIKDFFNGHYYSRSLVGQIIFYHDKEFVHLGLTCSIHPNLIYYDKGTSKNID